MDNLVKMKEYLHRAPKAKWNQEQESKQFTNAVILEEFLTKLWGP